MGKSSSSSLEPKKSTTVSISNLTSVIGVVSTLLLYIPIKPGIIAGNRFATVVYAQQQQAGVATDPLSIYLQILQSKVQDAVLPDA